MSAPGRPRTIRPRVRLACALAVPIAFLLSIVYLPGLWSRYRVTGMRRLPDEATGFPLPVALLEDALAYAAAEGDRAAIYLGDSALRASDFPHGLTAPHQVEALTGRHPASFALVGLSPANNAALLDFIRLELARLGAAGGTGPPAPRELVLESILWFADAPALAQSSTPYNDAMRVVCRRHREAIARGEMTVCRHLIDDWRGPPPLGRRLDELAEYLWARSLSASWALNLTPLNS